MILTEADKNNWAGGDGERANDDDDDGGGIIKKN